LKAALNLTTAQWHRKEGALQSIPEIEAAWLVGPFAKEDAASAG
jgi:hypothetical protein